MYAALALLRRGVQVRIVDTGLWPCSHSYALALHPASLDLMKDMGLLERVWEVACPVASVGLYDAHGQRAQIRIDGHSPEPMAVVRQSALEDIMEAALQREGAPVQWRNEVVAIDANRDRVTARISELEDRTGGYVVAEADWVVSKISNIAAQFVLGTDGHNSYVRQAAGLAFPEVGPAQYYAVFEFRSDADLGTEVRVVLGDRTADVLWPMPDRHCRWSFQLPDYSDTEAELTKDRLLAAGFGHFPTRRLKDRVPASVEWGNPPALDLEHLESLIAERAPWFRGSIDTLTWRTIVRFERRLAQSFGQGRLWLAGDAAHLAAPIGVQSMNVGLQEANDFAERVQRVLHRHESAAGLQEWNDHWSGVWRQLHGLHGGLTAAAGADPWIREHAHQLVSCLPGYGKTAGMLARQLGLEHAEAVGGS
jgi:2-polyprenyl-6-methoxyphenol hydroxylase-like FAD-dependent oxidoreductase